MTICITSEGLDLEAAVDPRFGRCKNFIFIDPDTMSFEAVSNENAQSGGGAGIQTGQTVSAKGATVVLTGNVGPNAFQTLNAAGIKIFTGVSGTVREAVQKYKNGEFKETDNASVNSHFGMGAK